MLEISTHCCSFESFTSVSPEYAMLAFSLRELQSLVNRLCCNSLAADMQAAHYNKVIGDKVRKLHAQ